VESNASPTFEKALKLLNLRVARTPVEAILDHLNNLEPTEGYAFHNYGAEGNQNRMYFTKQNACQIDSIRDTIEKWKKEEIVDESEFYYLLAVLIDAADHVANMSGTYGAFLKIWRSVALKKINLNNRPVFDNSRKNYANQGNAEELITKISGDILYLDPPYNQHPYGSNYFMLNVIAKNEEPIEISNVSGIPTNWNKSNYNNHKTAIESMKKLMSTGLSKSTYLLISYNNEGIITDSDWKTLFEPYTVKKYEITYDTYKGSRNLKERSDKVIEIMYLVSKK
jgi:adenine-specific DNA-methyltransferase